MPGWLERWLDSLQVLSWWEILLYGVLVAVFSQVLITYVLRFITKRTKTDVDDRAIAAVRWPIFWSVLFVALYVLMRSLEPGAPAPGADPSEVDSFEKDQDAYWRSVFTGIRVMQTMLVILWMRAFMKCSDAFLEALARRVDDFAWIEPRSLPLYEIGSKLLLIGGAIYAIMLVWNIDVTAWLASAGILGIAIGFAAKDTLANLFAGIFILTDAPYKLGDFIVLETGERGRVTDIGIRSTRILTRDDIEVTIPNSVMANSKIVNESSGPHVKRRLRVNVGIAYGTDVAKARRVMEEAAAASDLVSKHPEPSVRFRSFGDSALIFQVRGYIDQPVLHGRAVDQLCTNLSDMLAEAQVEIPFPQRVVHLPATSESPAAS